MFIVYCFYVLLNKYNGGREEEKIWEWGNNIKKVENINIDNNRRIE